MFCLHYFSWCYYLRSVTEETEMEWTKSTCWNSRAWKLESPDLNSDLFSHQITSSLLPKAILRTWLLWKKKALSQHNKKTDNPIKNGQKVLIDISLNKIHEWPINTWKGAQHHDSSEKGKLKPKWNATSHFPGDWVHLFKKYAIPKAGEDVEKLEASYTAGGNV